jgi:hypothetical protein
LSGTVEDERGAVIAGASITVVNVGTGARRQSTTTETGSFTIPLLPPSNYKLRVEQTGFAPVEVPDLILNVGDNKALQIQLKAGDVNAQVTIDSDAEISRTDAAVATVIDRRFVANMPLNGRSLQSLIALTPGVVFTKAGPNNSSGQFSVSGQRTNTNVFTVDGVSANFGITPSGFPGQSGSGQLPGLTALGGTNSLISVDALEEFKIQTSSYAPEFGRMPGGQILLLTRSGTNAFHGTLFDYLRNDVLDANDWFSNRSGLVKAEERQNDFGGVVGGPIMKNKTFFFFSYEGLRLRQPTTAIANVPTLSARQQVSDVVRPFFDAYPIPNLFPERSPGLARFVGSYSNPATLNAYSIRIDQSLGPKMTLFGTYKHSPSQTDSRTGALNSITSNVFKNEAVTLALTWLPSNSMTNDLRFNWSKARATQSLTVDSFGGAKVPEDSTLFAAPSSLFGSEKTRENYRFLWQLFNGSAGASSETVGAAPDNVQSQLNLLDTFSLVKGAHELKLGLDYRRISSELHLQNFTFIQFLFSPQPTYRLGQFFASISDPNVVLSQNFSAFAQDTWKANPRLTLTYGLRWELNPTLRSTNGHPAVFLDLSGNGPLALAPPGTPLYKTRYSNFAPRFGLAYRLSQKSRSETVVRGGVGLFYDLGQGVLTNAFGETFPNTASKVLCCGSFPYPPSGFQPPVPGVNAPTNLYFANPNLTTPYTIEWNAAVERSLGRDQTLTVSYVGAAGRRLLRISTAVAAVAAFGSTASYNLTSNEGRSDYRALQLQLQRRLSRGIQGLVSYTLSRSFDIVSDDNFAGEFGVPSQFINLDEQYGPSDFDVRHNLSGALTVALPAVPGPPAVRLITKAWALDGLLRFRTAFPTNVTVFNDFGPNSGSARANIVAGIPQLLHGPQYPGGKAINAAAFVAPAPNTQGNFPRNSLRLFNASQLDVALRRELSVTEKVKLQFRFEFFNILNHPNFTDPDVSGFVSFGEGESPFESDSMLSRGLGGLNPLYQIGGPRSGQIGLKIIF